MCQGSFNGGSGSFKEVSRMFKERSRVFQGRLKEISRENLAGFMGGCFNGVLSGFQGCLKEVE